MTEPIFQALDAVLTRWTMGSPAAPAAPPDWADAVAAGPGAPELRLLALAGQFLAAAVVAAPQGELRVFADLPVLALPTVPEPVRPLIRRLLHSMKQTRLDGWLAHFLAARGWTLHPADWMPASGDGTVPEAYAPWSDWVQAAAFGAGERRRDGEALTLESWDDFWPAERLVALAALRRHAPDAARALLEAKLPGESAEVRLRLLGVLAAGLSEADADLLSALASADRAPKVRGLAASLLAGLGRGGAQDEEIRELAAFFQLQTKGLLRRTQVVTALPLKTSAQVARRSALFEAADLPAFAAALGLSPMQLLTAWSFGSDLAADQNLATMVARTGSDEAAAAAVDTLAAADGFAPSVLSELVPRLDPAGRAAIVARTLDRRDASFEAAEEIARGSGGVDDPFRSRAGANLLARLKQDGPDARGADAELIALGLLASRAGAERALARLTQQGLLAADPRLDMIRLNAALDDSGGKDG